MPIFLNVNSPVFHLSGNKFTFTSEFADKAPITIQVANGESIIEDSEFNLDASEVAYMGDDLPDLAVLKEVGLACCPVDAVKEVKDVCHFISVKRGGRGAVRELTDLIYNVQKLSV